MPDMSDKHSPKVDDEIAHETQGMVRGGHPTHAEEFKERPLFLLRNLSRGRGVGFFEAGNFYPDFIIWLLDGEQQFITFADPHGLQHARSFSDSKVMFSKRIKQIEKERLIDAEVTLNAFILSPTSFNEIKHWDDQGRKARFEEHNILFMYDDSDTYVTKLFETVLMAEL